MKYRGCCTNLWPCFHHTSISDSVTLFRDIILNTGAEMLVAIAGDIIRMPGLPRSPQAERINVINGEIEGLS